MAMTRIIAAGPERSGGPIGKRAGLALAVVAALVLTGPDFAQTRDRIWVVGSSTVYPYSKTVAEHFADMTGAPAPAIESTGTGGGMKSFCAGIGPATPDIVAASRPIRPSETTLCAAHGVGEIERIQIGYDGLTLAQSVDAPDMTLTRAELYQALAARIALDGRMADNPFRRWSQIAPDLPDRPITVLGPPPTSGTRDAIVDLVMEPGCALLSGEDDVPLNSNRDRQCGQLRQDGRSVEAGENDNRIIQRLEADPSAIGIFGYSSLHENGDRLKAVAVDGILPNPATIADGRYPLARPLYLYVKTAHREIVPGLDAFLADFVSDASIGPAGSLVEDGLTPPSDTPRRAMRAVLPAPNETVGFN